MVIKILKPKKALNKAFLKVKPNRSEIDNFKTNLIQLLDRTNDRKNFIKILFPTSSKKPITTQIISSTPRDEMTLLSTMETKQKVPLV